MQTQSAEVVSLNTGKPIAFMYGKQEIDTGIFKKPSGRPLHLSKVNFAGDGQADLVNHGGPDKAVCVYAYEHYPYWERELERQLSFGAFGENITSAGLLEEEVCIGDIFRIGEAVVQVSQPRTPCHKLAKKHDVASLPLMVQETGYTGFYFRVLDEGAVAPGADIRLIERHPRKVSVSYANHVLFHGKNDPEAIRRLLSVDQLAAVWWVKFTQKLELLEAGRSLDG